MKRPSTSSERLRMQVAREAARLLAQGAPDAATARRRAAARLGAHVPAELPDGEEIRLALAEYRALFGGGLEPAELRRRRVAALEAMTALAAFDPRLTGPVLDGSAGDHDPVLLHLHTDEPEAVARHFMDRHIPVQPGRARALLPGRRPQDLPCWRLEAGGIPFELWVLPLHAARQGPSDPLDGKPLLRAGTAAVARLVAG
ncbi:hypothetical protein [Arenimonas fontis]|uniref:Uncharacterized protein n=1 Tax=Arenimonas fontis TaxID=2608255 RepID=A0A5B2ZBN1_9GAMM|nr:hypothetical protein [Arenimonas fontis]KAA2285315.1 hypothetical protein F0415_05200 [Arenimonas fontis]